MVGPEEPEHSFLANLGHNRDFNPALLQVEDGVGGVTLGEDDLLRAMLLNRPPLADLGEKGFGIEGGVSFIRGHDPQTSRCSTPSTRDRKSGTQPLVATNRRALPA